MSNAFPLRDNCPVPTIEAIEGTLVEGCTVPEAPGPCPQVPLFLFPPPSFNFGCYAPLLRVGQSLTSGAPRFSGDLSFPREFETGNCQPVFGFHVDFACEKPKVTSKIVSFINPEFQVKVTQSITSSGTCNPIFDFQIGFPCTYPTIGKGIFRWKPPDDDPSEIKLKLVIILPSSSSSQVCEWSLHSEVYPVCPDFTNTFATIEYDDISEPVIDDFDIDFDMASFVPEDHCPYTYDIGIRIPKIKVEDEEAYDFCGEGSGDSCECCTTYFALIKTGAYPYLEAVDSHTLKFHYAYRESVDMEVDADHNDDGGTHDLKDGPCQLVNDLYTDDSSTCGGCKNKVLGQRITIDTGGCSCTIVFVTAVCSDRFGDITVYYSSAKFENGILTSICDLGSTDGSCEGGGLPPYCDCTCSDV